MTSIAQPDASGVFQQLVSRVGDAPTIYLMARIGDYPTPVYNDALRYLAQTFPLANILPARDLWRSTRHWLTRWPAFQTSIHLGIVASTGPIGPGVARELFDLSLRGVPLAWFTGDDANSSCPLQARFRVLLTDGLSSTRFGILRRSTTTPDFEPTLSKPLSNALAALEYRV